MTRWRVSFPILVLAAGCSAGSGGTEIAVAGEALSNLDLSDSEAGTDDTLLLPRYESMLHSQLTLTAPTAAEDRDADGLPDAAEELLLRRYRPVLRFTKGESNWPDDPIRQLRGAQLKHMNAPGDGSTDPIKGCGDSEHHLTTPSDLFSCVGGDTNVLERPGVSDYCLNLKNDWYGGTNAEQARSEIPGLVGHVARSSWIGEEVISLQYWFFFAYNNQDLGVPRFREFADHEGDWTQLEIFFSPNKHRVVRVDMLAHGIRIPFSLPGSAPTCRSCVEDMHGPNYNAKPGDLFSSSKNYANNALEFYVDNRGFRHPVVYVERGGHEFWPKPYGKYEMSKFGISFGSLNEHTGDGVQFLLPDRNRLYNVGEVDFPFTDDARLILQYNGIWGCTNASHFGVVVGSPEGPAMHDEWSWPENQVRRR